MALITRSGVLPRLYAPSNPAKRPDGGDVLLVERTAAKAVFESVGVSDPAEVLTLWKQAGVLYLGGQVRGGFYIRRTHPEGHEFLALRWDQIRCYLPVAYPQSVKP